MLQRKRLFLSVLLNVAIAAVIFRLIQHHVPKTETMLVLN